MMNILNNMLEKVFITLGIVIFVIIIIIIIGDIMVKSQLEKDIEQLFSSSGNISDKVYSSEQIKRLPNPVQRYFRYSLQENQHYISYARLKHGGVFRTNPNQRWTLINGKEYFTVENPGFVWLGKTSLFSAKDIYCKGSGNLQVKLLSLIKIVDAKGKEINQGQILRWLGEAPLYPTALLPSERLIWEPIDNNSAKAILTDEDITVESVFYFNEQDQITKFKTKRYKEKSLENFTGHFRDYRKVDGMKIPFEIEAEWNLKSGDFSYAKFKIDRIEYNTPSKFK